MLNTENIKICARVTAELFLSKAPRHWRQVWRKSGSVINNFLFTYMPYFYTTLQNTKAMGLDGRFTESGTCIYIEQEGQHPLTGQRAANFRLLANQ